MTLTSSRCSVVYLNMLTDYVRQHQISNQLTWARDYLPNMDTRKQIPVSQLLELVAELHRCTGALTFGLDIGKKLPPTGYGIMSLAFMNCQTLEEVLQLTLRFTPLLNEALIHECVQEAPHTTLLLNSEIQVPEMIPLIELDFASMPTLARFLVGQENASRVQLEEVCFRHPPQALPEVYAAHFGCPVRFNQTTNRIRLRSSLLALPVKSSDPRVCRFILNKVEEQVLRNQQRQPLQHKVSQFIAKELPQGIPGIHQAAQAFNMSVSTLKKHLSQEGVTYSSLCDSVRQNMALRLIADNTRLKEICSLLGFSSASNLNRAFKRWTCMTPSEYRQHMLNQRKSA
ncbi:MAG: AraC family transcriptional regulator [Hahellaceae bacterium]|nr:AraC family transcriptional regulator [Hahellaceae bacterium]MCP5168264.1 AraC family transcriptional regulator [Hahellaceae bacterium]